MTEKFKDIPDYDGDYQVSNFGNVKSLKYGKERILKFGHRGVRSHLIVLLCKDGKVKTYGVHVLVAMAFLGHKPDGMNSVVDHKDNNPLNNHVDNLQILEQDGNSSANRQNSSHHKTDCGVCWDKSRNKWRARIWIGDKDIHLGRFIDKQDGLNMYKKALASLHLYNGDNLQFRKQLK